MPGGSLRSAVVVEVAGAAFVDEWRERTCADRPSHGVPAHVTVVFPFVEPGRIDGALIAALRTVTDRTEPFAFELREARRFPGTPGTLYLAPEPARRFVRLTEAFVARFPEHPPYEGAFDRVVPHLTVAQGDDAVLDAAEVAVLPLLPVGCAAHEALLLGEVESGRWQVFARLPFAG